jgi:hypothetical protein
MRSCKRCEKANPPRGGGAKPRTSPEERAPTKLSLSGAQPQTLGGICEPIEHFVCSPHGEQGCCLARAAGGSAVELHCSSWHTQASTSNFKPGLGKGSADECTSTLAPGGNVQTFANSLSTGEEGCLRGGVYTTPNYISIKSNGGTLAAYTENGPRCAPHST